MERRTMIRGAAALVALGAAGAGALGWRRWRKGPALPAPVAPLDAAAFAALYAQPLAPPAGPMRVYHLGHSLVGRDMPAMLAAMADAGLADAGLGPGHGYESQLGWGTPLRAHWEHPRVEVLGYEQDNAHPRFRPAREAIASGDYDAVVLTEAVEIRDAIRWQASPAYLARWAEAARAANPDVRVYLYETWHPLDDPEGFLDRLDADLARYWEGEILRGAAARPGGAPVWLIPAGQVLARAIRAAEAGGIPGVTAREDFFLKTPEGQDQIHMSDLGAWLVATTHYAVLYQQSPEGLPATLPGADGALKGAPSPEAALALQRLAWETVAADPRTGIAPALRPAPAAAR